MNSEETPKPERGIACPKCGCRHLLTTNTERLSNGRIRRRKVCRHCGKKLVTTESVDE